MASTRRLPGIQVDVAPPPAVQALPRMDIAVFVGFASTGPLHLAVPVDTPAQYAQVFGADAPLAWDARRGEQVLAYLGPAVRAFFANGGQRCWVIRVARSAALVQAAAAPHPRPVAVANRFGVSGVLAIAPGGVTPARAQARCEGSWSDTLRVSAALEADSIAISQWATSASPAGDAASFSTRQAVRAGDLLQVGREDALLVYARALDVAASATGTTRVAVQLLAAFEPVAHAGSPGPADGDVRIDGGAAVPALALAPTRWQLAGAVSADLAPGGWACLDDGSDTFWMRIDDIERRPAFDASPASMSASAIDAVVSGATWRRVALGDALAAVDATRGARLTLSLRAADPVAGAARLDGLGLTPQADTSFWQLQRDIDFYAPADGLNAAAPARQQRFPLAPEEAAPPLAWLPLGLLPAFGAATGPQPQAGTALERDGLSAFGSDLFLDPALAGDQTQDLVAHAEDVRLLGTAPRPLLGLHAAFGIGAGGLFNEASLLCIPDAVHLGWQRRADAPVPGESPRPEPTPAAWVTHRGGCPVTPLPALDEPDFGAFLDCTTRLIAAPVLAGPDQPVAPGAYRLAWTDSEAGALYSLREAGSGDFADEREVYRGSDTQFVALDPREGLYHYRVIAAVGDQRSAPSNPVLVQVRTDAWEQTEEADAERSLQDEWLAIHRAALRLAAASGDLLAVLAMPRHFRSAQAQRHAARLRAVHPPTAGADPAFAFTETATPSYGALYFPWLQSNAIPPGADPASVGTPRIVPPDGLATGVLAARAFTRGAWIAPANEPLKDIVALAPDVPAAERQALQDAQINLLRADPRGFFALSADTLALDTDVLPISVRRLLILLRRVALLRGTRYVFEPEGPTLRRSVERGFEQLLATLYARGAFAGATPAQAFRVVTDDTVNTPADLDAGRFFVELRVAPSVPMRFLGVRLAQDGERLSVAETA